MKKIKLILVSLFAVAMTLSCDDDGGDSKIDLKEGAIPNIQKVDGSESFINLSELQEGNDISMSVDVNIARGQNQVASVNVVGFYIKADGSVEKGVLASNITTFPAVILIKKETLLNTFTSLVSVDDFSIGDELKITTDITLKDGTILNLLKDDGSQNFGQDIANSTQITPPINVTQSYFVSCPSDLGGTYSVVTSGASTDPGPTPDENPISDFLTTVTITDNGGGNYTMSDAYGGLYLLWYDIYGITSSDTVGTFTDVCGTISSTFDPGNFVGETVTLTGTVNDDGTLTIHWENNFGDFGDSVYTKN